MSEKGEFSIEILQGIHRISEKEWDRLVPPDDPFMTHAFLHALEESGSASINTGWMPLHILCRRENRLVGGAPLYLKNHSYGEYIFDWGWADAARRAGVPYYPKLLSAVPFTPASGRRLLIPTGEHDSNIERALLSGMMHVAKESRAQALHILFCTEQEHQELGSIPGIVPRTTFQYHWTNPGVSNFEEWLSLMRARRRKEIRRERRVPKDLDVEIRVVPGADLTENDWQVLESFYRDTVERKWGQPYLTPDFFKLARVRLAHLALGILAVHDGEIQASALFFQRGSNLYGRYWGCRPGYERLHFELCYHRPIELCLTEGWTRFEAGAQGDHKISRGLLPAPTHSVHWVRHTGLSDAVQTWMDEESQTNIQTMEKLAKHGPFRKQEPE